MAKISKKDIEKLSKYEVNKNITKVLLKYLENKGTPIETVVNAEDYEERVGVPTTKAVPEEKLKGLAANLSQVFYNHRGDEKSIDSVDSSLWGGILFEGGMRCVAAAFADRYNR